MGAKNCPETPRQRMIAMMYLVLTALLALNVSREIVEAFIIIEDGLSKTVENIGKKNNTIYANFRQAESENPKKVKEWREYADVAKRSSDQMFDYIQDIKIELIEKADGDDQIAVKGRLVYPDSILKNDNITIGSEIMIGATANGRAYQLREEFDKFKETISGLILEKDVEFKNSIDKNLSLLDPPNKVTQNITWENAHFQERPLIAIITLLSKMQGDVRNAESDVISYLYKQIDASSFKFNKLDAVVKAKSNYVFKGGVYEAEVFLAAFDTTQKPTIYIGPIDSTINDDGTWNLKMKGELGINYDTLSIHNSIGKYSVPCNTLNPSVKWGGLIYYKTPEGRINKYRFSNEYQVAESQIVVSPSKMNVFYLGVKNPIDISVPGVPIENITPRINNGTISKDKDGGYIVKPKTITTKSKKTFVTVFATIDGKEREMGKAEFRVKKLPNPVAKVAMSKGGRIAKNLLLAQNGVLAELENSDFDATFKVVEFSVSTVVQGYEQKKSSRSNKFTNQQKELLNKLNRGQRVFFEGIKAKGPDKLTRDLPPIVFKIK
jgi:gliding motility-associated protein GldM